MDGAAKRRTASGGYRAIPKTRRSSQTGGTEGDRRRLIQLGVSLALFLLVYIGRGVFPTQLMLWQEAASENVDFKAAFQQFSANLARGEPMQEALEVLCVTLLGGRTETAPVQIPAGELDDITSVLLSRTARGGLDYLNEHGILEEVHFSPKKDEPIPSDPVNSSPAVVTAVAQTYTDDGIKLPKNVSLAFYELGLSETSVPVDGAVTSGFGYRDSPINGKKEFHLALDIGAPEGAEIGAFAAGTVEYIGASDEFGNYLKISHENNVSSFYAHCSKLLVHKGDMVTCGQTVALVGHTGNAIGAHLHLTIEKDNIRLDPAYYVELS